jgi:5-methylcytosine-specific restriction endonuclease McrA
MKRPCLGPRPGVRCPGGRLISGANRCPDCRAARYRYRDATRDQFARRLYGSADWKSLSRAVVDNADRCAWCGTPKGLVKLTAGHIVSVARDRSRALDSSNVAASCASCQERAKREPDPSKWRGVRR